MKESALSTPVWAEPPALVPTAPPTGDALMEEVADSAEAASAAREGAPPAANQGVTAGKEGAPPATEGAEVAGGDGAPGLLKDRNGRPEGGG
jgi:hypothetical protein